MQKAGNLKKEFYLKLLLISKKLEKPYLIMLCIYVAFTMYAFISEPAGDVLRGFINILTSQSVLVTDYIAVGGLGATLLNSAVAGFSSLLLLKRAKVKPNGAIIAALWLTLGFTFFGKNIYNMIPLTIGVWLFSRFMKEPFSNYSLVALLVATVSPTVSEISFLGVLSMPVEILFGILFGFLIGFIFPAISASTVKVHGGYDLYNMGFAGGLICLVGYAVLQNIGVDLVRAQIVSEGNTQIIAIGLYIMSFCLLLCGIIPGDTKKNIQDFREIQKRSGRLVSDFYFEYGKGVYINMACLGFIATTVTLVLGAELNGITLAGIFTIIGFGAFGKHVRNVLPVIAGAILAVYINRDDPGHFSNIVSILFATGLAPIAGQYGIIWGIIAGFLHLNVAIHTSEIGGGMNLYANGFAAGFVAMLLLPIITALKKERVN